MYVVRHPATKQIVAIRLCEDEAFEVRDARNDWEELEVAWESTEAHVLLSEIKRIGMECVIVDDFENGNEFVFKQNEKNEIVGIVMLNGLVEIDVETIRTNYFDDAIVINENITIKTYSMEVN